jgi:isocitrate dehydrogenase
MKTTSKRKHEPATPDSSELNAILYDRFAEKSREIFDLGKEKGRDAWEKAMDVARRQMAAAGAFSAEQGEAFKRFLRKDFDQAVARMNRLGKEAKVTLHPARMGAGALSSMAKVLGSAGGMLTSLSEKAEQALTYESGEITMAGTLTCTHCGKEIHLKKTSVVPVCSGCQGTTFRKGY